MSEFYDREGNPISMERWMVLFEDKTYQVVRQTKVGDVQVSTIWLGADHGFGYSDEPILFETMIFGKVGEEYEEQYRYHTEEEALAHHRSVVRELRLLREATRQ